MEILGSGPSFGATDLKSTWEKHQGLADELSKLKLNTPEIKKDDTVNSKASS